MNTIPAEYVARHKGVLITAGVLSVLVGFLSIAFPLVAAIVLTQFLGAAALASGAIALSVALFGKHAAHRVILGFSGLLRIAAGLVLWIFILPGVAAVTLLLAVLLVVEGLSLLIGGTKIQAGRGLVVVNGLISLALGLMIYAQWPGNSDWVISTLFGINLIFSGASLLALALAAKKA